MESERIVYDLLAMMMMVGKGEQSRADVRCGGRPGASRGLSALPVFVHVACEGENASRQ